MFRANSERKRVWSLIGQWTRFTTSLIGRKAVRPTILDVEILATPLTDFGRFLQVRSVKMTILMPPSTPLISLHTP